MAAVATRESALELRGITKAYRAGLLRPASRRVLDDLSFAVPRGEVFGYLGPNGSGKTTTIKIVTGLVFPDSGTASILGEPLGSRRWRFRVGYLPEHPYLYDSLTPLEYLDYAGRLFGLPAALRRERGERLLERVGLTGARKTPMRRFSKGMLQRAGLAQALINEPELVFLDEPMSGLDPLGRRLVHKLILDLRRDGRTVFFSTHILSDAESLCDRVAVLRAGRLLSVGPLDAILEIAVSHMELLATGLSGAALEQLPAGVLSRQPAGERWRLEVAEDAVGDVVRQVQALGGRILALAPVRQSLEDYFIKEMGPADEWTSQD